MRLKGLKIVTKQSGEFTIIPLYFGKRGGTVTDNARAESGVDLIAVASSVLAKLIRIGIQGR